MNGLESKDFQLVILPLSGAVDVRNAEYYSSAAACWETVWLQLYENYSMEGPLFLDGFLRQHEGACIFHGKECVAMILFRTIDFRLLNYRRDSYFKEWTDEDISCLIQHGPRVLSATYLSVLPKYRNFSPKVKLKEVLLEIMVRRFLELPVDVIAGVTRRDRGVHDESYKLGATLVHEDIDYMSGRFRVDLVAFYRHEVRMHPNPKTHQFVDQLWTHRLDLNKPPPNRFKAA